jgi:hypothetical protein
MLEDIERMKLETKAVGCELGTQHENIEWELKPSKALLE